MLGETKLGASTTDPHRAGDRDGRRARPGHTRWGYETWPRAATNRPPATPAFRRGGYASAPTCICDVRHDRRLSRSLRQGRDGASGLSAELIVIAAVIIGGARSSVQGPYLGSYLGALLVVLINKVLREAGRSPRHDGHGRKSRSSRFTLPPSGPDAHRSAAHRRRSDRALHHPASRAERIWARLRASTSALGQRRRRHRGAQTKGTMSADRA